MLITESFFEGFPYKILHFNQVIKIATKNNGSFDIKCTLTTRYIFRNGDCLGLL